jgi:hypothetical protein
MATTHIEVDIAALARVLHRSFEHNFVVEDFHAGFNNGPGPGHTGLKYPLRRLSLIITDKDEEQLAAIVDALRAGATTAAVATLADAIRTRDDASPLARVLADLAKTTVPGELGGNRGRERVLAGAMAGAYLGLTSIRAEGATAMPDELLAILGAAGGALAVTGAAILRRTEALWAIDAGDTAPRPPGSSQ